MAENEKIKTEKKDNKIESKIKELKIELLKQGSKRKDIRRELAKLLTLQQKELGGESK